MTDRDPGYDFPTPARAERLILEARRQRAEAMLDIIAGAARALLRIARPHAAAPAPRVEIMRL